MGARIDSAEGQIVLDWDPVPVRDLAGYEIFRDHYDDRGPERIGSVRELVFRDSTFGPKYAGRPLVYRIKAIDSLGNTSLYSPLATIPSAPVDMIVLKGEWSVPLEDKIPPGAAIAKFVVRHSNRGRSYYLNSWSINETTWGGSQSKVGKAGLDSTEIPLVPGENRVRISGFNVLPHEPIFLEKRIIVAERVPRVSAGPDTGYTPGDTVRLRASVNPRFGQVASWEWDIGLTGEFRRTSGPDTSFPAPALPETLTCAVRATTINGKALTDTVKLPLYEMGSDAWIELPFPGGDPIPDLVGSAAVSFGDSLLILGGMDKQVRRNGGTWKTFDGRAWTWRTGPAGFPAISGHSAAVFQGRIFSAGGTRGMQNTGPGAWVSTDGITWSSWDSFNGLPR